MRFLEDGPDIPDDLLYEHDANRVVFFCGAGVSSASAELPDFLTLANRVVEKICYQPTHPARLILNEINILRGENKDSHIAKAIPIDSVFFELEREYSKELIIENVHKILQPSKKLNTKNHRIILDLCRGENKKIRLVTTNFDRLFSKTDSKIKVYNPPVLPKDWNGVVHLHGRLPSKIKALDLNQPFILSSSDFGKAYLTERWAADFFSHIIEKYTVVFIGYTANDPPIKYILSAISSNKNRLSNNINRIYAFQSIEPLSSKDEWETKGVVSINYQWDKTHSRLWNSLEKWSKRAKDESAWFDQVIEKAIDGPANLTPHERGQVAHILNRTDGVRRFAEKTPSAEWLCVMDSEIRLGFNKEPRQTFSSRDDLVSIHDSLDKFSRYMLDSDPILNSDSNNNAENKSQKSWDFFRNEYDYSKNFYLSPLKRSKEPLHNERLFHFSQWMSDVSSDPITPWWAARNVPLHSHLKQKLLLGIDQSKLNKITQTAWDLILRHESKFAKATRMSILEKKISHQGWGEHSLNEWIEIIKPSITVRRPYNSIDYPLELSSIYNILEYELEYSHELDVKLIPVKELKYATRFYQMSFINAINMEKFRYGTSTFCDLEPLERFEEDNSAQHHHFGINVPFFQYFNLMRRLQFESEIDAEAEFDSWPRHEVAFDHLRIWCAGNWRWLHKRKKIEAFSRASTDAFWGTAIQRDLLHSLRRLWADLSSKDREAVILLLIRGPKPFNHEMYPLPCRADIALTRLEWLNANGCDLGESYQRVRSRLIARVPDCNGNFREADLPHNVIRSIQSDTDPTELMGISVDAILDKSRELSSSTPRYRERSPFRGFVAEQPELSFTALMTEASSGKIDRTLWGIFLRHETRKSDSSEFKMTLMLSVFEFPNNLLFKLLDHAAFWIRENLQSLIEYNFDLTLNFIDKLVDCASECELERTGNVYRNGYIDWMTTAVNSTGGYLAETIMRLPTKVQDDSLSDEWLMRVERVLSLPKDYGREATTYILPSLNFFYERNAAWTETHLLKKLNGDIRDKEAFFQGLFWSSKMPTPKLFAKLKPYVMPLIGCANTPDLNKKLAHFLVHGWVTKYFNGTKYLISTAEFRKILLNFDDKWAVLIVREISHHSKISNLDRNFVSLQFFDQIWPKQISFMSTEKSNAIFELICNDDLNFVALCGRVYKYISKVSQYVSIRIHEPIDNSVWFKDPPTTTRLLNKILHEDPSYWPYGTVPILQSLARLSTLKNDSEMIELRQRLSAI